MSTYEILQQRPASEKVTLAKVKAARRLMAWVVHSGSIYKKTSFDFSVIDSITQNGVAMTEVASLALVVANTWFNDRSNKIIYMRTSGSTHPNGEFISMKFWNFFSTTPTVAPYDLNTGKEVFWIPLIKATSFFGVELDNTEQIGFALEGSGSLTLINDREYWDDKYEGYIFEQQPVEIYSHFLGLDITEAKLIYKALVNAKSFTGTTVSLKLKDTLSQLRSEFELQNISEISTALVPEALLNAKQRRIYGKVYGNRPTNIDQVVDGYLLPGTVSVADTSNVVTGSGTTFLTHFSPDDRIIIDGEDHNIITVASNTSMTVGTVFEVTLSGLTYSVNPNNPKIYTNRRWLVAGHECRQPTTTVASVLSLNKLYLTDATDFDEGDQVFVNASGGEVVTIQRTNSSGLIVFAQNLVVIPVVGTTVTRFCAQDVRINNRKLEYNRDYTLDFTGNKTFINLDQTAERNVNTIRSLIGSSIVFSSGSRTVTGVGTVFTSQLQTEQWIRSTAQFDFFQILSIESDTSLTLRSPATYSQSDTGQYISERSFEEGVDVLTCSIIGTTSTDLNSGTLLRTASEISKDVVTRVGITNLNAGSFSLAKDIQPAYLGFCIPDKYADTRQPKCRDIINRVNQSVFGSLIQNKNFEIEYNILQPKKPSSFMTLREEDILEIAIDSDNDRVVKGSLVNYKNQEYNAQSGIPSLASTSKTSDIGSWLVSSMNTKVVDTVLHESNDAAIHASRWAFLLELATNSIKIKTKMQTSRLQVNDVVYIEHEKLFERTGGGKKKFAAVTSIKKSGTNTDIELDDLGNAFNRVAIICENGSDIFDDSTEKQKVTNGFVTDQYGLINNTENTHGLNLVW